MFYKFVKKEKSLLLKNNGDKKVISKYKYMEMEVLWVVTK